MLIARHRPALLGSIVVVLVGALAACGGSSGSEALNVAPAREKIAQLANQQFGAVATVGVVRCPQQAIPQKQGTNFFCTVDIGGVPLRVDVSQTDDQGGLSFQAAQALLITSHLEAAASTAATNQGTPASKVSCGTTPVLVETPGHDVDCAVTFANGSAGVAKFKVTAVDGDPTLVGISAT